MNEKKKGTAELFADWMAETYCEPIEDRGEAGSENQKQSETVFPVIKDGQPDCNIPVDNRSTRERFAEWAGQQLAYDPFRESVKL